MLRSFVVAYGTRAVLIAAHDADQALDAVLATFTDETRHWHVAVPDRAELAVREAVGPDWSTFEYCGSAPRLRTKSGRTLAGQLGLLI